MNASQVATVAGLRARCVLNARDLEASADRHECADPDRASQARDDAAQCRAEASALAALLTAAGAQVRKFALRRQKDPTRRRFGNRAGQVFNREGGTPALNGGGLIPEPGQLSLFGDGQ